MKRNERHVVCLGFREHFNFAARFGIAFLILSTGIQVEADPRIVFVVDGAPLKRCPDRSQSLLSVQDKKEFLVKRRGGMRKALDVAEESHVLALGFPVEESSDREPLVDAVHEVDDLCRAPHELSLKRWKSNATILDVVHQRGKIVLARVDRLWLRHPFSPLVSYAQGNNVVRCYYH